MKWTWNTFQDDHDDRQTHRLWLFFALSKHLVCLYSIAHSITLPINLIDKLSKQDALSSMYLNVFCTYPHCLALSFAPLLLCVTYLLSWLTGILLFYTLEKQNTSGIRPNGSGLDGIGSVLSWGISESSWHNASTVGGVPDHFRIA